MNVKVSNFIKGKQLRKLTWFIIEFCKNVSIMYIMTKKAFLWYHLHCRFLNETRLPFKLTGFISAQFSSPLLLRERFLWPVIFLMRKWSLTNLIDHVEE